MDETDGYPQAFGSMVAFCTGRSSQFNRRQNDARYAFFGDQARLAVDLGDGKVAVYETGDLQIFGVQQQQDDVGRKFLFVSQYGEVDLGTLKKSFSL